MFHNTEDTNTIGKGRGSATDSKTMTSWHLSAVGELNPAGDLWLKLSATSPTPCMNQWDSQLTPRKGPRMAWHDTQTSVWPTSGRWSICALSSGAMQMGGKLNCVQRKDELSHFRQLSTAIYLKHKYGACDFYTCLTSGYTWIKRRNRTPIIKTNREICFSRQNVNPTGNALFVGVSNLEITGREAGHVAGTFLAILRATQLLQTTVKLGSEYWNSPGEVLIHGPRRNRRLASHEQCPFPCYRARGSTITSTTNGLSTRASTVRRYVFL